MENVKYSVVVPVYNSEKSLFELHERLVKVFGNLNKSFELILVDDGSKDKSWEVMQKLHEKDKRVRIIQLMKNFGQNNALMCGFGFVNGEGVIVMDDDLQHPPEEIPKLIHTFENGYDIVYGQYFKKEHIWFRNLASKTVYGIFSKAMGISLKVTAFKIVDRKVIDEIVQFKGQNPSVDVYIANVVSSRRVGGVGVHHVPRKHGNTNYTFIKLSKWASNVLFNSTVYPLNVATFLGFSFSLLSFFLAIIYLLLYLFNDVRVSGFTTLILAITFFSGMTLFVLGIIGRYIGNIFLDLNNRPQFVIRNAKK